MIFSYDCFNKLENPFTYLANANKKHFGAIQHRNLVVNLKFNAMSEITFTVDKYHNGIKTSFYDDIEILKTVELSYIGWFQIIDVDISGNGQNETKQVTALSLENQLTTKTLTSFGSMEKDDDWDGGLDRYTLYNIADPEHSILHIIMEQAPTWKVGYIDPNITTQYRAFNNNSVDAYSFLMGDVSEKFECVFVFDTFEKSISAYKLNSIGKTTNIYLAYRNLINQIDISYDASNVKTVMSVAGGDYHGSPLNIIEVNPSGNNQLSNFSYYKKDFSDALRVKYELYEKEYNNRLNNFSPAINRLQELQEELSYILNRHPDKEHSMNWNEYGLVELKSEFDYYEIRMANQIYAKNETERLRYYNILYGIDGIKNAISQRKTERDNKLLEIEFQKQLCQSLTLNLQDYLGEELYKELTTFAHHTDFVDDTFIATDIMTDDEILEMQKELYDMAMKKLIEISSPHYTMKVNSVSFVNIPEFIQYSEQLELGNIITVEFEDGVFIESRLLELQYDWESKGLELTFSSKNKLNGAFDQFVEVQANADSASRNQTLNGTGWNKAKNKVTDFTRYMTNSLNVAKQKLINSTKEDQVFDESGFKLRRFDDTRNDFSPNQSWLTSNLWAMTTDNWQTVRMAIGELQLDNDVTAYGINAEVLLGKLILGETLVIQNENNTFTMDKNGLTASADDYKVIINPDNPDEIFAIKVKEENKLYVDTTNEQLVFLGTVRVKNENNEVVISPEEGFSIYKDDEKIIFLDSDGNANFSGNVYAKGGEIAGFKFSDDDTTALSGLYYSDPSTGKYIRFSPLNTRKADGTVDTKFGSLDIGYVKVDENEKERYSTLVHLRSDGYVRFGKAGETAGVIKINDYLRLNEDIEGTNPTDTMFYSKNFKIYTDDTVEINSPNLPKPLKSVHVTDNSMTVGYDNGSTEFNFTKDSQGKITKIESDGRTINVTWG